MASKKQLKDYLPFYLGCEVLVIDNMLPEEMWNTATLLGIDNSFENICRLSNSKGLLARKSEEILPLLRNFDSMDVFTEDEINELHGMILPNPNNREYSLSHKTTCCWLKVQGSEYEPEIFRWLLSKYIDLFGLIPKGLAKDKSLKTK